VGRPTAGWWRLEQMARVSAGCVRKRKDHRGNPRGNTPPVAWPGQAVRRVWIVHAAVVMTCP